MRYRDIFEAPLADYQLIGDWDNDGHNPKPIDAADLARAATKEKNSFVSKIDRQLVKDPSTRVAVEKAFRHLEPNFYIIFYNSPNGLLIADEFLDNGPLDTGDYVYELLGDEVDQAISSIRARDKDGVIVVLSHNEGGNIRHKLTPWMIAHRIAHAVNIFFSGLLTNWLTKHNIKHLDRYSVKETFYVAISTFRSARTGSIWANNKIFPEIESEILTQYLMTGRIRLQLPRNDLVDRNGDPVDTSMITQEMINELETEFNNFARECVSKMKGVTYLC